MLILLVDNSPEMVTMLRHALEMLGHQVMTSSNGSHALDTLASAPSLPDIIFSDLAMPHMDGFGLLSEIRQSSLAHLPFIAVTGRQDEAERAVAQGADDYLLKPFQLEQLENLLNRWTPN